MEMPNYLKNKNIIQDDKSSVHDTAIKPYRNIRYSTQKLKKKTEKDCKQSLQK